MRNIVKVVWVYVMLGSATGFVALLLSGLDSFASKDISTAAIVRAW